MTMGEMRDRNPELHGVGGWLAFLCVNLVFLTPAAHIIEITQQLLVSNGEPYDRALGIAFDIGMGAFAVVTGSGLIQVWRNAVRLAKTYYFVNLGLGLLVGLSAFLPDGPAQNAILGAWLCIISAAWLGYLYRSERVRSTYGKNTVRDAAEVFR
jgi:hypothetical protein